MYAHRLRIVVLLIAASLTAASVSAQPPSAELAVIIGKWQTVVAEPQRFEVRGDRIIYNAVFETETCSEFSLRYYGPDDIRFESRPDSPAVGTVSIRRNERTGQPYRIEPASACLFFWKDREVIVCHERTSRLLTEYVVLEEYQTIVSAQDWPPPPAMPEDSMPWWQDLISRAGDIYVESTQRAWEAKQSSLRDRSSWGLLGFWFFPEMLAPSVLAADSPEFMHQMDWTITKRTHSSIRLEGRPNSRCKAWFQRLDVILDHQTGRPFAQRMIDPSGNLQTVLVFKEWDTNPAPLKRDFDRDKWVYEILPLPAEIQILKHRRKK